MRDSLCTKVFDRELTSPAVRAPTRAYRSLYSSRSLISDLDIVNELDGHSGCVNALSWSKSGNLLASGSDDEHLNIHVYEPSDDGTKQFKLGTTVATGHTQNIFSVKFMPGHSDRVCVTAAGDAEVRVFDLEYAGSAREASSASTMATQGRRRGRNTIYNGVKYLGDGDTDCRVYQSHADRVKRIVTESSPYLFLTCSEDGEVRQWDIRQPSSAYPPPRSSSWASFSDNGVPPPLISYKRYNLDLNTISCSPSQPHYIALGGAHLHCFLHDRRMTGRDRLREAGKSLSPSTSRTSEEEELMAQATQCVRKFAPKGQQRMKRTENGHITACKISDARPDEMVVSWSGDHIYSFDLVRSPDANEREASTGVRPGSGSRVKAESEKKRKRKANSSHTSLAQQEGSARGSSRPRTEPGSPGEAATALRVRYQNGQSEEIPLSGHMQQARQGATGLNAKEREAQRIARTTVTIRSALFGHREQFTTALGEAASIISGIDTVMREWRYPMDPTAEQVAKQQLLRRDRESTRRFVQASGTLARVLGGKLQTGSSGPSPLLAHFTSIEARSNDMPPAQRELFGYDFIKAILLWLESGIGRLIEGFTKPPELTPTAKSACRFPIPESEASPEAIDDHLIPYLLAMASDRPIVDLETNRFEVDENRQLFSTEKEAVLKFASVLKIPFADLSSAAGPAAHESGRFQAVDREIAMMFWGFRVARGVLLNAAEGVTFTFVDRAFGGLGRVVREVAAEEEGLHEIGSEDDTPITDVALLGHDGIMEEASAEAVGDAAREAAEEQRPITAHQDPQVEDVPDTPAATNDGEDRDVSVDGGDDYEDDDDDNYEGNEDEDDDDSDASDRDSSEPDEIDGVPNTGLPRFLYTSSFERRRRKEKVEANVPCSAYTRMYRGHCNVRTVKDVNYFGLDDEYVVSGSDDGNFFIWDRKTAQLVNILEGDGEVVNVVQGHPYETMLAVSGIDHTVKIFSPDARARAAARLGDGIAAHDASEFSSIMWPQRIGRRASRRSERRSHQEDATTSEPAMAALNNAIDEDEEYIAPAGLASRKRMQDHYRIVNKNDMERRSGNQDTFITRSMLARLAAGIRARRPPTTQGPARHEGEVGGGGEGEDDESLPMRILLEDDCAVQ